ncbi:MAG: amidohydrolase family protein [Candidatus Binatia bacterium]
MIRGLIRIVIVLAVVIVFAVVGIRFALAPPVPLAVPLPGVVLSDVTVVNPGAGKRAKQTVVVRGVKIDAIRESRPDEDGGRAAEGFAGSYVLPGLVDMHVHHPPGESALDTQLFALLFLAHGVTVRDTGNLDRGIFQTRRQIEQAQFPGPRIFTCGAILDGDPPIWSGSRIVTTPAEAKQAVDEADAAGADCIKIYSRLSGEALAAVRAAALERDLPVIGHVPFWVKFEDARLFDVQHLTGVPESAPMWSWVNPNPFDWIAAVAADFQHTGEGRIDLVVKTSAEQGIAHTPTLVMWDRMSKLADYASELADPAAGLLPAYWRNLIWNPELGLSTRESSRASFSALGAQLPKIHGIVRRLHEAGVRIHAGTDTMMSFVVPGASLHEELELLVDSGFSAEEAWSTATRVAGESLGEAPLGVLENDAPADFLIFKEDPTVSLAALSTLQAVVAQGRLYRRETLQAAIARYRERFESPLYDTVATWLSRLRLYLSR